MRLSADLIGSSEQRTNDLGEREIVLRGLAIPAIEHLGVTRDAFDAIDMTDNRLSRLENFPRLNRLSSLYLSGNVIETIDANNLEKNISHLIHLDLSHNRISSLFEVGNLGSACKKLEILNLDGNPVTRRQHYRLYTIKHIPSLKVLDFERITKTERNRAERLANSAAGAALESDVQEEGKHAKTFTPGEGKSAEESFVVNFTPEEKEQIRQMVANAKSPQEIEEIERSVKRGIFPGKAAATVAAAGAPNGDNRKRPAPDGEADASSSPAGDSKKQKTDS
ncbi:leucine rich repeat LRR-containing protein [Nitzschia inconspicua]|uniref:Leucine rich repeat LRR-containing protein n=1 Tax=Nitzschia inconspicua TaxID=303405 RepID=A0A9K3PUU2_9STRA|nr:leucine rich repeat LRR-containing protein [Nitzschia inconspicua]